MSKSPLPRRVIILRGTMASGKSHLERMLKEKELHLLAVPALREAIMDGYQFVHIDAVDVCLAAKQPLQSLACQGAEVLIVDACIHAAAVAEAFAECEVEQVVLVAPRHIIKARRRLRYISEGIAPAAVDAWPNYVRWDAEYPGANYVAECAVPDVQTTWVNTADYPWVRIGEGAVVWTILPTFSWPVISEDPKDLYQQVLRVGGAWYGNHGRIPFEEGRMDAVLPERCDGMTVMDVGGSEGGFCFEAVNRGAAYAMDLEIRQPQRDLAIRIRNSMYQPVSVADINLDDHDLPTLTMEHSERRRWDMILMLNILHRVKDPKAVLQNALDVSNYVVVEAPYCMGDAPRKHVEGSLYPETWHFPPVWMKTVAEGGMFAVESIETGPYAPEQRLIYKLRRVL